jgi:hypothetical protein
MKLIRKTNSPAFIDQYGVHHPHLTLSITYINEDKLNKRLRFICHYFHEITCSYLPVVALGEVMFDFSNDYINPTPGNGGWPTYTEVKEDVMIHDDGTLTPLNEDMGEWILNQPFILDLEGKKFIDNWEIIA